MATFTKDVQEIRQRAMQKIEEGAVTDSYKLDKDRVIEILNEALATEIVCVLRYQHHYFMATGVHGRGVADLFKEHADEERAHADAIAERIQQLGGKPNFNPGDLVERSVSQYIEGETLADMIREDLIAERMVIDVYQRMIEYFGTKDPTTRTLIEHIKSEEEEHASELSDMLFIVNPQTGKDEGQDPGTNPLHRSEDRSSGEQQSFYRSSQGSGAPRREIKANVDEETPGRGSRSVSPAASRSGNDRKNTNVTNRSRDERVTPKAPRSGGAEDRKTPGASGRPMNRRGNESVDVD